MIFASALKFENSNTNTVLQIIVHRCKIAHLMECKTDDTLKIHSEFYIGPTPPPPSRLHYCKINILFREQGERKTSKCPHLCIVSVLELRRG